MRPARPTPLSATLLAATAACAVAVALSTERAHAAASQSWPPFVLVAGLLLVGVVAHGDGLFEALADRLVRLPGSGRVFYVSCLVLVAAVTAVLNLDTAAVFLTPVLIHAARRRGLAPRPFLYGTVFMANASSLFLPGSNLTNLLVLAREPGAGATFAMRILPAALTAAAATAILLALLFRRELRAGGAGAERAAARALSPFALTATVAAAVLTVALADPALPVLGLGVVVVCLRLGSRRLELARVRDAANPTVLGALFAVSVALGTLARAWDGPARLLASAGTAGATALGALGAVAVNNLPAAVLLSARPPGHPRALLLGLNLGPNLAVTGSLSAFLWWQAARQAGARPSAKEFSRLGLVLAPAAMALSGAAIAVFGPA